MNSKLTIVAVVFFYVASKWVMPDWDAVAGISRVNFNIGFNGFTTLVSLYVTYRIFPFEFKSLYLLIPALCGVVVIGMVFNPYFTTNLPVVPTAMVIGVCGIGGIVLGMARRQLQLAEQEK